MPSRLTITDRLCMGYQLAIFGSAGIGGLSGVFHAVRAGYKEMKNDLKEEKRINEKVACIAFHTMATSITTIPYGCLGTFLGTVVGIASPSLVIIGPYFAVSSIRDRNLNTPKR